MSYSYILVTIIVILILVIAIIAFKDDYKKHRGFKRRSLHAEEEPIDIMCDSEFSVIGNRASKYIYGERKRKEEDTDIFLQVLENKIE